MFTYLNFSNTDIGLALFTTASYFTFFSLTSVASGFGVSYLLKHGFSTVILMSVTLDRSSSNSNCFLVSLIESLIVLIRSGPASLSPFLELLDEFDESLRSDSEECELRLSLAS